MKRRLLLTGTCLIALLMSSRPVLAQTAPEDSGGLDEVIVTAQRRAQNAQAAALSIDVLSTDALAQMSASRAADLSSLVPAAQFTESGNGQQSLFIRGVGTLVINSYTDPAVAFNVDGVYVGRPSSMTGVMYDLARVEVLKGPQGTLYGRNATGGAVNILPNLPQIGKTSVDMGLTVGNYGEVDTEGALNLPVSENSAARFAFTYLRHDGYMTDDTGDADSYAGRVQYLITPSDTLSLRLNGDYAHDGGHGAGGTITAIQNPFTGTFSPSPLPNNVGLTDPRSAALFEKQYSFISGRFLGPIDGAPFSDNRFWGLTGDAEWATSLGTISFIPAHRESDLNNNDVTNGFTNYAVEHDKQTSVEARMASEDEGLIRWLAGGYFFDEDIHSSYQFDQQSLAPFQALHTGTTSEAAFGQITIAPTSDFRWINGGRLSHDHKFFSGISQIFLSSCNASTPIPACPAAPLIPFAANSAQLTNALDLVPIGPFPLGELYASTLPGAANSTILRIDVPITQAVDTTKFNWHEGLEYDVSKDSLLYANWSNAYHSGGFAFAHIAPSFKPEYLTAFSLGSKNRFLDGKLQLNLEAYYWIYKNQQISHGGTDTTGAFVFYTENAGASTNKGLETSIRYRLLRDTTLDLEADYLDATYNTFHYVVPAGGTNPPPVTSCAYSQTSATLYTVDCSGKQALRSPRWSVNFGIKQTAELGDFSLLGQFDTHYQSSSMVGFEMLSNERQKAYAESNLSLTLTPDTGTWAATAFVNNIQDERPTGNAFYNSTSGFISGAEGAPRTFGVRAEIHL